MSQKFSELGISSRLLAILAQLNFETPTPIQEKAIPLAIKGRDVIGIAQTGTGKTLAFSIPLLMQIAQSKKQGLIVLPTRELAIQVDEELQKIGRAIGLKTAVLIGGGSMQQQIRQIKNRPHIIIGTPGRMNDHLEQRILKLGGVGVLILDEADRMLDMGFAPQIKKIVSNITSRRQTMLFSATMPKEIMRMVNQYMKDPVRIEVSVAGSVTDRVDQELFVLDRHQKNQLLDKLLAQYNGTVLVFSRTKHGARKICRAINNMGHGAAEMHSNLTLGQRRRSLEGFKKGQHRVLVATDIASRGIDVNNIELVINYDLPDNPDDYVHRVGRTGRAGKKGKAISFATPDQKKEVYGIERSTKLHFPVSPLPQLPPARQGGGNNSYQSFEKKFSNGRKRTSFKYVRGQKQRSNRRSSQNRQRSRNTGRARVRI